MVENKGRLLDQVRDRIRMKHSPLCHNSCRALHLAVSDNSQTPCRVHNRI